MDPPPQSGKSNSSPPFDLTCPFCHVSLTVPPSQAGAMATCPECSGKFQVPMPTAQHVAGPGPGNSGLQNPEVQVFASKKIAAGICGILLGGMGVHKFILGFNTAGAIMLSVWVLGLISGTCLIFPLLASFAMNVIGIVEGIIYLTKSDEEFFQTYAVQKKDWF